MSKGNRHATLPPPAPGRRNFASGDGFLTSPTPLEEEALRMSSKSMLPLLALVLVMLAFPTAGHAQRKVNISVGIGDQSAEMFDNQAFLDLRIRKARYFISWNAIDNPGKLQQADAWLAGARRRGVRPLFHLDGLDIEGGSRPPSVAQYRRKVRALVRRYRSVREWGVWNEGNSRTQPVFRLSGARRTAKYFLALRGVCRGCTIVALDLLDAGNTRSYIRSFYRALGRKRRLARIVGIHNYGDTNRARRNNTRTIIRAVRRYNRRAQFWITETGGLAYFATETRTAFPCNERRQARAVAKMFTIARRYRRYVKRLYPYNFYGTDCDRGLRFDAGIIRRDGSKRPAYNTLRRAMRNFRR